MNTKIDCKKWRKIAIGIRQDLAQDFLELDKLVSAKDLSGILELKREIKEDIAEVLVDWNDVLAMIDSMWSVEDEEGQKYNISERRSLLFKFNGKEMLIRRDDTINDICQFFGFRGPYRKDMKIVGFTFLDEGIVVGCYNDWGEDRYTVVSKERFPLFLAR